MSRPLRGYSSTGIVAGGWLAGSVGNSPGGLLSPHLVLDDISMGVARGEAVAIVGAGVAVNGAVCWPSWFDSDDSC